MDGKWRRGGGREGGRVEILVSKLEWLWSVASRNAAWRDGGSCRGKLGDDSTNPEVNCRRSGVSSDRRGALGAGAGAASGNAFGVYKRQRPAGYPRVCHRYTRKGEEA